MRTTIKVLEAKVNIYNSIESSIIKLKLNDNVVGGINLYTVDNQLITSGKLSEVAQTLDALVYLKHLEDIEERKMWH